MPDTRTALLTAIANTLDLRSDAIADDQTLDDLGADSLDMVEIAMETENALDMVDYIKPEVIETGTVAQIIAAVDAMRGNA